MEHRVTLLMSEFVTHDVKRFVLSKPDGFSFQPGQGVELAIDRPRWKDEGRPFTPTSLPEDRVLELTVKGYPEHEGMTRELHALQPGAELLMSEPFGTISYQGPGVFVAAGAGVTPFIAILRDLARSGRLEGHGLIFSNKTPADVICEKEFRHYLGERCVLTCTRSEAPGCPGGRVGRDYLAEKIRELNQRFYVCGPPGFVEAVNDALQALGASPEALVFER
ncbi:MAG: FAD-binding oxidoreductase [Gammaproteobacteria bacterium]|jgi:cytochrome-b5 reductase